MVQDILDDPCTNLVIISKIEEAELSDYECDEVNVDASDCGKDGADDVHSYGHRVSGCGIEENTEDVINSDEATLRRVEDHGTPDTSQFGHIYFKIIGSDTSCENP